VAPRCAACVPDRLRAAPQAQRTHDIEGGLMRISSRRIGAAIVTVALAASAAAHAGDAGWYFGIGAGGSNFSGDIPAQATAAYAGNHDFQLLSAKVVDDGDRVVQAFAGYRFNPWLALEMGWHDFGEAQTFYSVRAIGGVVLSPGPAKIDGAYRAVDVNLAAVVSYPLGERFELLARGGVAKTRLRYDENGIGVNGQPYAFHAAADDHTGALVGVGAAWHFSPLLSLRVGVDRVFDVGQRFELGVGSNGRFDHIDAWAASLVWSP
jgi:hypothetical protein